MRFPPAAKRCVPLLSTVSATALAAACVAVGAPVATADDDPPPPALHQVKYTVWAEQPFNLEIYYRDVDPPNWAAYSNNPYQFTPNVEADVGPHQQWNLDVGLADPDEWAMVVSNTGGVSTKTPNVHCVLAVDGVVVATSQGPKGALCSIRNW